MFSKKLLTGFSILALTLSPTIACAHGRNRDAAAFFFLKSAAMSVPQVIESVQKEESGQVISFRIKTREDHPLQYEMKILKGDKVVEAKVDPKTGKVLKTESEGGLSHLFGDRDKQPLQTKLSLKDAITIVEKHYGSQVLGGALQRGSEIPMFRIEAANSNGAFAVMVDANKGELFRAAGRDRSGHHEEAD